MPTFDDAVDHHRSSASSDPDGEETGRAYDELAARLATVERALSDGDTPVAQLDDAETIEQRLHTVETAVEDLTDRVAELEAASSALRGYAAGVRAVNEDVERRADLALAKAETIERSLCEDPGLQVERLDPGINDERSATTAERQATKASECSDTADTPSTGVGTKRRQAGDSESRPASDSQVSAAVKATQEIDDTASSESTRRSLSSRLREIL